MRIEERDIQIFETINKYRILSTGLIQNLIFKESSTFRRRLKKLTENKFLYCIPITDTKTGKKKDNVYFLREAAFEYLKTPYRRQSIPKPKYLIHAIDTIACRIQIEEAIKESPQLYIRSYNTERDTKKLDDGRIVKIIYDRYFSPRLQRNISITPDSTFILELKSEKPKSVVYFIEVDESTETHNIIANKVKSYWDYFNHSEGGQKRYMQKNNVNIDMMRVLFITKSEQRIKRIIRGLSLEAGLQLFFFTTFNDLGKAKNLSEKIFHNNLRGSVSLIKST